MVGGDKQMKNNELDVWESLLIRNIKSQRFSVNTLRRILARRCGLEFAYVTDWDVLFSLSRLMDELKLSTFEHVMAKCAEQTRCADMIHKRSLSTAETLIFAISSVLKFTNGECLSGYRVPTWFSRKNKAVTP
jgi:hypothetical protein